MIKHFYPETFQYKCTSGKLWMDPLPYFTNDEKYDIASTAPATDSVSFLRDNYK